MRVPRAVWFSVGRPGEPYPERLRELEGRSGCYLIRLNGGRVVYVGESHTGRLRKTLTRHFQGWKRSRAGSWHVGRFTPTGNDPGVTYDRSRADVAVFLTSPGSALALEAELIRMYEPSDNVRSVEAEDVPF